MGPYSHIVVASRLAAVLNPADPGEYYWGAVVPDIRYVVEGMARSHTHIPPERRLELLRRHPDLKSFLQGYWVHCLADELDMPGILGRKFPLNLSKHGLSHPQCTFILELFNISRQQPIRTELSGNHNPVLEALGVETAQVVVFASAIQRYLSAPNLTSLVHLYQTLGLADDSRLERYRAAGLKFQQNRLRVKLIYFGLQTGRINQDIASMMLPAIPRALT